MCGNTPDSAVWRCCVLFSHYWRWSSSEASLPAHTHTHAHCLVLQTHSHTLGTCAQTLGEEFCSLLRVTNTEEEQPDGTSKTFVSPYTERTRCDCNTRSTNDPAWSHTFLALFSCACCLSLWSWVVQAAASYVLKVRPERAILPDRPPCSPRVSPPRCTNVAGRLLSSTGARLLHKLLLHQLPACRRGGKRQVRHYCPAQAACCGLTPPVCLQAT